MYGADGIHHIGIAVRDLDEAAERYALLIGARVRARDAAEGLGTAAAELETPSGPLLELVAPLGEETPVGKFLAKRGEGMHHVAYGVQDIDAEVRRLLAAGVEMIDEEPRSGLFGHRVAFIHPDAAGGVLVELVHTGGASHG